MITIKKLTVTCAPISCSCDCRGCLSTFSVFCVGSAAEGQLPDSQLARGYPVLLDLRWGQQVGAVTHGDGVLQDTLHPTEGHRQGDYPQALLIKGIAVLH